MVLNEPQVEEIQEQETMEEPQPTPTNQIAKLVSPTEQAVVLTREKSTPEKVINFK